jgi:glutaredoxin 3
MARVVVYSAMYCGYCRRARALLERLGIEHEVRDVTVDWAERRRLTAETGRTTVPNIFVDGRSIGGHDELVALEQSGELARLLGL